MSNLHALCFLTTSKNLQTPNASTIQPYFEPYWCQFNGMVASFLDNREQYIRHDEVSWNLNIFKGFLSGQPCGQHNPDTC